MRLTNLLSVILLLLLPTLAPALSTTALTILIPPSPQLPQPAALPPSTTASLTTLQRTYSASLRSDNGFRFRNVSAPGSYLLSISCATHAFPPLRVDVARDGTVQAWRTFRGNDWGNRGEEYAVVKGEGMSNVLEIKALGGMGYYMERQGCECFFPVIVFHWHCNSFI
jgi:ER membrane protein complex subunit 7